jgi:hypothetical protein
MKTLLALASVTALALSTTPVAAQRHAPERHHNYRNTRVSHHQSYRVGHRFGPRYSYTSYSALPRTYVTRYHLSPRYRYVYNDGYIYVINPTTWAVMRILSAF